MTGVADQSADAFIERDLAQAAELLETVANRISNRLERVGKSVRLSRKLAQQVQELREQYRLDCFRRKYQGR